MNLKSKDIWLNSFYWSKLFSNDGAQLYLIFQPICKTIKKFSGLPNIISQWESNGLSNEKLQLPYTTNKCLSPILVSLHNSSIRWRFEGSCLKQEDTTPFTPSNNVNLFIVYELDTRSHKI